MPEVSLHCWNTRKSKIGKNRQQVVENVRLDSLVDRPACVVRKAVDFKRNPGCTGLQLAHSSVMS